MSELEHSLSILLISGIAQPLPKKMLHADVGLHDDSKEDPSELAVKCQSTTLHTEPCAPLNISEALPCTLMHCIADSTDCTTTVLPPASAPPHVPHLVVCLFVYLCHWCTCCLLCLFISSSCCFQY